MPTSTPVPALVRSKTSTRRPAIRQHSARSCSINPLDLHRTRDGRIARAKSTPGISYNEAQQQLLWASSQYLQEEARPADVCSEPDPFLQDACASQITYSEDHFTLQPLPDLALTSNIQYLPVGSFAAPDVDPLTDFFPPQVDFLTCSPPEVVATNMSSGYGQHGSYGTSYSTGESQSSQTQQSSIPAHSTPALTYAASYSSSPPTVSGSPALSQASAAFVPPPAHAPHYHPASLPSLDLSRVATTQAYQQPLASPHAYSHPMYQHHPAHHPGSPPPQGYLPHPQQPAYGPSYPGSPTGYYAPTPYTGYAPPATPGYYSSGYDPSYGASHHAGASSDAGGSRSVRGGTSEPDQTRRGVGQGQAPAAICNDHGCNGRPFSTFSNFLRHQRERSGAATKATCHLCGATFTRTTARNGHLRNGICRDRAMRASGGGGESDLSSDGHTPE